MDTVADLEGVQVVRLNPPLGPNYFSFMGKFMNNQVIKLLKMNPLFMDLNPTSRNPGSAPGTSRNNFKMLNLPAQC